MKKIGLIGGGGAFASQQIFQHILRISKEQYNAQNDDEFPNILLHNVPFKNFDKEAHLNNDILEQVKYSINIFEYAQCDIVAIACNTMHYFIPSLLKTSSIPIYNLLEGVSLELYKTRAKTVGILCSDTSSKHKIHQAYLTPKGIHCIYPSIEEQHMIDGIIGNIIAGNNYSEDQIKIENIKKSLALKGCDSFLLGCTELSLINSDTSHKTIDSSLILAQDITQFAFLGNT